MKQRIAPVTATVMAVLPDAMLTVKLESGEELTAHVAEEFRRVSTSVRPGDRVMIQRASRNPHRGTIVGRAPAPST
jgi:translation initiation factor IF-1